MTKNCLPGKVLSFELQMINATRGSSFSMCDKFAVIL